MGRILYNDGEEVVQQDHNDSHSLIEQEYNDDVLKRLFQDEDGFIGTGFSVTYIGSTTVQVGTGRGFQTITPATVREPAYVGIDLDSPETVVLNTPDGTNPRIDLICVKSERIVSETDTRKFKHATTGVITNELFNKVTRYGADVNLVTGTPAASPSVPSTPAGYLAVAQLYVHATTGLGGQGDITDVRNTLAIAANIGVDINTSAFTRVATKGPKTPIQTVCEELDGVIDLADFTYLAKTGDYVILDADGKVMVNVTDTTADRTITLPTAADNFGNIVIVKNSSTQGGKVIVDGEGSETIDGNLTVDIPLKYDSIILMCDGSNWHTWRGYPDQLIQDFTTIGSVGSVGQQAAGHMFDHNDGGYNEPGTGWAEVVAYYKWLNSAMTTDVKGTYTLTDNGGVIASDGIFGSDYAAQFDGGADYYTQATLLATTPSAIAIDFWFKADDGQPASSQTLCRKINDETGASEDFIYLYLATDGHLKSTVSAAGSSSNAISTTLLIDGATPWHYVCLTWDTTNGVRLFLDGKLEGQDSAATTLMSSGSTRDFIIAANNWGGAVTSHFAGKMALFRVRSNVLTQKDVDLGYATKYTTPSIFSSTDFQVLAKAQEDGDSEFESEIAWGGLEVARNSTAFYRYGDLFGSSDKLKLIGRK